MIHNKNLGNEEFHLVNSEQFTSNKSAEEIVNTVFFNLKNSLFFDKVKTAFEKLGSTNISRVQNHKGYKVNYSPLNLSLLS